MKFRTLLLTLSLLALLSSILVSCTPEATMTPPAAPTTPPITSSTPTSSTEANWWDKFGEPQYGGEITAHSRSLDALSFDPCSTAGSAAGASWLYWEEQLFTNDWTVDREVWSYIAGWVPTEYRVGLLAEDWEQTGPTTVTVKLREGIKYHDKPPVNGRELTSEDVEFTYDRVLGTGHGFTEPAPLVANAIPGIEKVTAIDKYTVEFKLKEAGIWGIYQVMEPIPIMAPEWYENGDRQNWQNAVGTSPWMVSDFIEGAQITFSANPDYWGCDERHPENKLPYIDTMKTIAISDQSTTVAAIRTGQLDMVTDNSAISWTAAVDVKNTNPDLQQRYLPMPGYGVELRVDKEPFTDIKVRTALQMAINHEIIANEFYKGTVNGTPCGIANPDLYKDWITPYDEWPAELREEYSFNPERAKELLAEAGYPDGFDTNCIHNSSYDTELMQIVMSYFGDIGVNVEVEVLDAAAFGAFTTMGKHDQMVFTRQMGHCYIPPQTIGLRTSGNRQNISYNNDAYFDSLVEKFNAATSIEESKEIMNEADQYMLEQHWAIFCAGRSSPMTWQPWVKGYSGELNYYWALIAPTRARLWIDQDLKESMGY